LSEITAWRLCNGEGDQLPGLAIDVYDDFAVVELSTPAWAPHRDLLVAALGEVLPARGVLEKSRLRPGREGEVIQQLAGVEPPEELVVREGPASFAVTLAGTSKSGLFIDQRETRGTLRRLARAGEVLNVFSYTGALSVASAQGGARRVVSVDLSRPALSRAQRNFELNGLDPDGHEWIQGDAFEELPSLHHAGRRFDLVILDPPAFATSKKRVFQAERDWRDLVALGTRLLRPLGVLVASSPMAALSASVLERALADGAQRAGADLRVFAVGSQPPDFPVDPATPERRYLKVFFACRA
jgi:23S rRNA (cytosine1962-C5)-methyltransferase